MERLRTPEHLFASLKDYPYPPNYVEVGEERLRLHYLDEGARDGPVVLLLHGEPTWSYLYRNIIPRLAAAGCRVLAPDLIGFGRSDKPTEVEHYSYQRHVDWLGEWFMLIELADVTLFCQDWGGLLGLRLVARTPGHFRAVIASNTGLPTGEGITEGFLQWLEFSQRERAFPVGRFIQSASRRVLDEAELAAYEAPFPEERYKAGARAFPTLVPLDPEIPAARANKAAWHQLEQFDKPFVTAFSDGDPITARGERWFQKRVPGARGQRHPILSGGHFIQEDAPDEIAALILEQVGARFAGLGAPRDMLGE